MQVGWQVYIHLHPTAEYFYRICPTRYSASIARAARYHTSFKEQNKNEENNPSNCDLTEDKPSGQDQQQRS